MGGKDDPYDIVVKKSSLNAILRTRLKEREGCLSLPFTVCFFTFYTMGIMNHENVRNVYLVESGLRGFVEDYSFDVAASRTLEGIAETRDFWLFMKDALLPMFMVQTDHLGNTLPKEEWGRVLSKNFLKGGILLEQFRDEPFPVSNVTSDFLYYQGEGTIPMKDVPGAESLNGRRLLWEFPAFNDESIDAVVQDRALRGKGGSQQKAKGGAEAAALTYPFFFFEQEPMDILQKRMRHLEEINWIDHSTSQLNVKVIFVNKDGGGPGRDIVVHLKISFFFPTSGGIFSKIYFQSSYEASYTSTMILTSIGWICLLGGIFLQEVKEVAKAFNTGKGEVLFYFQDIWNCVDWASIVFGFAVIGMSMNERSSVASVVSQMAVTGPDVDVDPTYLGQMLKLHKDMQNLANMSMWYRLLLADYTMVIMLRFFKAFKGQARLAVVTNTIVTASTDLVHFAIVFLSAFLTYTFAGMILFGRRIGGFSTFQKSFGTCFAIACGDFDWALLVSEHALTATIWFWSFMILIFLVMLNMVLAIVMDVYTSVRADAINGDPIWINVQDLLEKAKEYPIYLYHKFLNSPDLPPRDVSDVRLVEVLHKIGSKVTIPKLKAQLPDLTDEQCQRIFADVACWEEKKNEEGLTMSDAFKMISTINHKVESLVRKIDFAHSQDPNLKAKEDPQIKARAARNKFKRAIFVALYNGELEKVASAMQSEAMQDELRERDMQLKIKRATNIAMTPARKKSKESSGKEPEEEGSHNPAEKGKSEREQRVEHKMVKEFQALKSQTKAMEASIADMSSCLKGLASAFKKAEERENRKDAVGAEDRKNERGSSVPVSRGRRKRRVSPGGYDKDYTSAFNSLEDRLDDISITLQEVKTQNEEQSKMISTNDYDTANPRVAPIQNGIGSIPNDQVTQSRILVTESRILEMNLLMKDVHTAVNAMNKEGTRPQSASSTSRSRPQSATTSNGGNSCPDKTQGLVLRDIRGLIHRTQSIGTMLLEVLSSLNDVRAASMLQAKLLEHGVQPRNMNMASEGTSPSPQSNVHDSGQKPDSRGPPKANSRPLSASSYAGSRPPPQVPQNMRPVSWGGFSASGQMPQPHSANTSPTRGFHAPGPSQQNFYPENYQQANFPDPGSFQDLGPPPMSWEGSEHFQAQGPMPQSNPYGNMEMPFWSGSTVGHPGVFPGQNFQPQYPVHVRQPEEMMDPSSMNLSRTLDPYSLEQQQTGQELFTDDRGHPATDQNPDHGIVQQPQMDENTESAGDTVHPAIPGMAYDPDNIEELQ
eukprot:gnl/MRDRNA2_/MRDRNA2_27050_c0_seq1.p1 gnl/MRDRNA2_/MRDRNA2_27050_c0~~gnl/MRDRNA2_/MRDRNA2_27050_c0_seq1.p1  ORF type:complete len:1273 (+),score=202.30 gnl/MRDRNA2_/MRDRNA2_27050_c0_seq1:3-3821(+)